MKALLIAQLNLRRLFRVRSNIFFVFVFPMLLILVLGATFGGAFKPRLGVVAVDAGPLGQQLIDTLSAVDDIEVETWDSDQEMLDAVEHGEIQAGLVIPEGYDATLRAGGQAAARYFGRSDQSGQQLRPIVSAAVSAQARLLRAAAFASAEGIATFDDGLASATALSRNVESVNVSVASAGEALFPESLGRFDLGASSQLLLFVFLTSMTGAVALIETRRLGVSRRMLSTPTPVAVILLGEALGRLAVALMQGVFIMLGSLLVFRVDWGDPLGALAVMLLFCAVSSGAAMALGASFRQEQQAVPLALLGGLGLGALGGSMVPLEIFSPAMRAVAHATPHAWALDAFAELVRHDGTLFDILPELGILAIFAAVLMTIATWQLRRAITS